MLAPPFINTRETSGEAARARALLVRAGGLVFVLYFFPELVEGLVQIAWALFVRDDPRLYPRNDGYPNLLHLKLHGIDALRWACNHSDDVLGFGTGLALLLWPYHGPRWGEPRS